MFHTWPVFSFTMINSCRAAQETWVTLDLQMSYLTVFVLLSHWRGNMIRIWLEGWDSSWSLKPAQTNWQNMNWPSVGKPELKHKWSTILLLVLILKNIYLFSYQAQKCLFRSDWAVIWAQSWERSCTLAMQTPLLFHHCAGTALRYTVTWLLASQQSQWSDWQSRSLSPNMAGLQTVCTWHPPLHWEDWVVSTASPCTRWDAASRCANQGLLWCRKLSNLSTRGTQERHIC